jgi:hypothetical protein
VEPLEFAMELFDEEKELNEGKIRPTRSHIRLDLYTYCECRDGCFY